MESYIDMLDIIENAIKYNASSDVILNIVKEFKSNMEEDLNSVKEKMRYCKKLYFIEGLYKGPLFFYFHFSIIVKIPINILSNCKTLLFQLYIIIVNK